MPLASLADEHIDAAIVAGLRRRHLDVVTVQELGLGGSDDAIVLAHALQVRRVILTNDVDFLTLAADCFGQGVKFAPICFWPQQQRSIGDSIRAVVRIATTYEYDAACSNVFYL